MRAKSEFVSAVDFGSREVRVLVGRKDPDGTIHIVGHGLAPSRGCVSQGVIQDLGAAQVALSRALTAAEKEARTRINTLFCGMNGKNVETFIREGKVRLEHEIVEDTHMKEALDLASRDILAPGKHTTSSIAAQEWYVDDLRVIDPINIRGQILTTRVHFARLPAVIADNLESCIRSQRRELEDLIFLPLASALGCLTPEDMDLGVAVLDMGYSTTGLAVYRDHRILGTHSFEWGGHHMTRDVAAGLQVSFEEAEELICEYGITEERIHAKSPGEDAVAEGNETPQDKARNAHIKLRCAVRGAPALVERSQLDEIIYDRANELLTKVRQHLHARGHIDHLVRGVVLTGGASMLKNYTGLAETVFEAPCRVGLPDAVEILPQAVAIPEFSAAAGVIRHAFEYRNAVRAGRIEGRGPSGSGIRRLGRVIRKYFF